VTTTLHITRSIQKSYGQSRLERITPPSKGPIVGPSKGPSKYHPKIPARSLGGYISLIVPPPFAMATPVMYQYLKLSMRIAYILPNKPARVRRVMSTGRVFARAVGICNSVNTVKQTKYNDFFPKVSLRGASISGPIPNITTNPVWQPTTAFSEAFKDSAI
jgi:hypothetical protein